MAYTPINWQTGDTITAAKLNRCDNGWSVSSGGRTLILNETVTTAGEMPAIGQLAYSEPITALNVVITLDGVEYQCQYDDGLPGYGDMSFSTYPFVVMDYDGNILATPQAGTYSLKIESVTAPTVEVSQSFAEAVALHAVVGTTTFGEIDAALAAGRLVVIVASDEFASTVQLVATTDKSGQPLAVYAINAAAGGVSQQVYVAATADSPITAY